MTKHRSTKQPQLKPIPPPLLPFVKKSCASLMINLPIAHWQPASFCPAACLSGYSNSLKPQFCYMYVFQIHLNCASMWLSDHRQHRRISSMASSRLTIACKRGACPLPSPIRMSTARGTPRALVEQSFRVGDLPAMGYWTSSDVRASGHGMLVCS